MLLNEQWKSAGKEGNMKMLSIKFFLPSTAMAALVPYHEVLEQIVETWNDKRRQGGTGPVLGSVVVGSALLPPRRDDRGYRMARIAEFRGGIGPDHGDIYSNPDAARDEMIALAGAFDAEIAKRSLPGVSSEITVGFSVWPRDAHGVLAQMRAAA